MGGLTGAVDWWQEWQLRILVLTSLLIQFLLLIFSILRRHYIPGFLRFTLWLAYLAGDAVAIYALATLFNRHKATAGEDGGAGGGSDAMLQVVWAPVLLMHLGGHDGITAYNIEDNELWSRHLLTAVSQITVAIYVFWKTWPLGGGDKWLFQAAITLFVPGVLKCLQKPWALKRASIYSLVSSPAAAVKHKEGEEMYAHVLALEEYVERAKVLLVAQQSETEGEATSEDEGNDEEPTTGPGPGKGRSRRRAMLEWCNIKTDKIERRQEKIREIMYQGHNESSKLFVDLSSSYSHRLSILEHFCGLAEKKAYGSVRQGLATAFLLLYTKLKVQVQPIFPVWIQLAICIRCSLPWAATFLFHRSHREAYNHIDVKITYVILCCTAVLEYSSISHFGEQLTPKGKVKKQWPEMVSQYSLIGYFARNMKHSKMMWIVRLLGCKDFLDQHWRMKSCFSSAGISELVLRYLKDGWKEKIHGVTSYRSFNNHRSSEGLRLLNTKREKKPLLFDESVLLWHIATDFCFFSTASSSSSDLAAEVPIPPTNTASVLCRQMSNYMAYLLFVNPEMLLPGSRRNLFKAAHQELQALFKDDNQPLPLVNERELTRKTVRKIQSSSSQAGSDPQETTIIQEAWVLAKKLQSLGDEKKMWEVIQGVWVEMLCLSASRCRGYLHAKALGTGGEFLSYVWLLLFYMGMETFTDKLHREDLPSDEAAGTGSGNNATAGPTMSTSEISMAEDMV